MVEEVGCETVFKCSDFSHSVDVVPIPQYKPFSQTSVGAERVGAVLTIVGVDVDWRQVNTGRGRQGDWRTHLEVNQQNNALLNNDNQ